MSPLSTAELNPFQMRSQAALPQIPQLVRWCLQDGFTTATSIKNKLGLPLEEVYEGLVWLEGHGKASVVATHAGRGGGDKFVSWGAL